jgi:hypothetical protein
MKKKNDGTVITLSDLATFKMINKRTFEIK